MPYHSLPVALTFMMTFPDTLLFFVTLHDRRSISDPLLKAALDAGDLGRRGPFYVEVAIASASPNPHSTT